jgi:hypothetical protein
MNFAVGSHTSGHIVAHTAPSPEPHMGSSAGSSSGSSAGPCNATGTLPCGRIPARLACEVQTHAVGMRICNSSRSPPAPTWQSGRRDAQGNGVEPIPQGADTTRLGRGQGERLRRSAPCMRRPISGGSVRRKARMGCHRRRPFVGPRDEARTVENLGKKASSRSFPKARRCERRREEGSSASSSDANDAAAGSADT